MDSVLTPTAVSKSVYDHVNDDPDFSTLVENIDLVDMQDIVDRDLPLTFLAPNNAAFRRIAFSSIETGEILKRHLVRGLFFCDVLANTSSVFTTAETTYNVEVLGPNKDVWVGGARIYECDILSRNGVLHYVDRVIGESFETEGPTQTHTPTATPAPTMVALPTESPTVERPIGSDPLDLSPVTLPTVSDVVSDGMDEESGNGNSGVGRPGLTSVLLVLLMFATVVVGLTKA